MRDSTRLYGASLEAWKNDPYEEVLVRKLVLSKQLLARLVRHENMEDTNRISDVVNAHKFNRKLLEELGYDNSTISKKIKDME